MRFIRLLPLLALAFAACPKRAAVVSRAETSLTIFVTGDLDLATMAQQAETVREARWAGPCLWLVCGDVLKDQLWTELTDAEAPVRLLEAAGVDAVLMGPEWLRLGAARCRELADAARFYLLSTNVRDSSGSTIGHEFLTRQLGNVSVGVAGFLMESSAVELRQSAVTFVVPALSVPRTGQLLRTRAAVTCALQRADGTVPGFDLSVGSARARRLQRYDVVMAGGQVSEVRHSDVSLTGVSPDERAAAVLDSLQRVVDSLAAVLIVESKVRVSPAALSRALVREALAAKTADQFCYDTLVRDTIRPGVVTQGTLCRVLGFPGRLALVDLDGRDLAELGRDRSVTVEARTALKSQRLAAHRSYTVAMTLGFMERRFPGRGYRLADALFWRQAAAALRTTGGGR